MPPYAKKCDSLGLESNGSGSEITRSTIINNEPDPASARAESQGGNFAGIVDGDAKAKGLNTQPIDCSNSVASSESAKPAEDDASKIAAGSETATLPIMTTKNGIE